MGRRKVHLTIRNVELARVDQVPVGDGYSFQQTSWNWDDMCCGNFAYGRYAWRARNPRKIGPIPWLGRQGFFEVNETELRAKAAELMPYEILPRRGAK